MPYIALGCLGFLIIHLFDLVSLKRLPMAKPLTWILGTGLLAYGLVGISLRSDKLWLPTWAIPPGWALLITSLFFLIYSLFLNLPFRKTYIAAGVSDKLITSGLYALVRHPGVLWFASFMFSLVLVAQSRLLLIAAPTFIALDVALVTVQDKFILTRMFAGYRNYQKETPMLLPNPQSINAFITWLKQARAQTRA